MTPNPSDDFFLNDPNKDRTSSTTSILLSLALLAITFFFVNKPLNDIFSLQESLEEVKKEEVMEVIFEEPVSQSQRYVEANPMVAPEEPEPTPNFAALAQQAAQEELFEDLEPSDFPTLDGEEISSRIVEAEIQPEVSPEALIEPENAEEQTVAATEAQQADQEERVLADLPTDEGEGLAYEDKSDEDNFFLSKDFDKVKPQDQPGQLEVTQEARPKPRPRPRIKRILGSPGPLMATSGQANKIGKIAVNARFSQFGEYIQRMQEAIIYQWHLLGSHYDFSPEDMNSAVLIEFHCDLEGRIMNINVLDSTASDSATLICKDAILSPAPFGPWTEEMVRTLGDYQPILFKFAYR